MDQIITPAQAKEIILQTKGHLFGVTFTKKDGSLRNMVARLGVRKGVKGVQDVREQDERWGYVRAYDFNANRTQEGKGGFRKINLNTLQRLKFKNQTFTVKEQE